MLLSPENIQQQTRALWETTHPELTADFLDLYFQRRYADERNVTVRHDAQVKAAVQILPFKFLFGGKALPVGVFNGLCAESGANHEKNIAQVVRQAHRKMYEEGQLLSFLIPEDEKQRKAFEKEQMGSFWTATHRLLVPFETPEDYRPDLNLNIMPENTWGRELWTFYNTFGGRHDYEIRHDRDSFETAVTWHLQQGGQLFVARRRGKIVGFCLVCKQPRILKSGKPSKKDCYGHIRFMLTTDPNVVYHFRRRIGELLEVEEVAVVGGCPGHGFKEAKPYAMARVVDVLGFLKFLGRVHPGLQLTVGIENDEDIPENNGYYELFEGEVTLLEERPDNVLTAGGLAALLLGSQPVQLPLLLDD